MCNVTPWSRWAKAAENHTCCHSCKQRSGNWAHEDWTRDWKNVDGSDESFCYDIWVVGSEFWVNNMKAMTGKTSGKFYLNSWVTEFSMQLQFSCSWRLSPILHGTTAVRDTLLNYFMCEMQTKADSAPFLTCSLQLTWSPLKKNHCT